MGPLAAFAGGSSAEVPAVSEAGLACGHQKGAEDVENMALGRRTLRRPVLAMVLPQRLAWTDL